MSRREGGLHKAAAAPRRPSGALSTHAATPIVVAHSPHVRIFIAAVSLLVIQHGVYCCEVGM